MLLTLNWPLFCQTSQSAFLRSDSLELKGTLYLLVQRGPLPMPAPRSRLRLYASRWAPNAPSAEVPNPNSYQVQ